MHYESDLGLIKDEIIIVNSKKKNCFIRYYKKSKSKIVSISQMSEDQAFFLLRHLMFRRGLRKLYLPDMAALQLNLYQLSRLLHDRLPAIYNHFDDHEVSPTLYAAPWLLTLFASQFPLGFVTRVFGKLLNQG